MKRIEQIDFYETLQKTHTVLEVYDQLKYKPKSKNIFALNNLKQNTLLRKVTSISLFPSYFQPSFCNETTSTIVKVPQKKIIGYSILLDETRDVDLFLQNEYHKNFKRSIKRYLSKFETCFNANYKMFYGDISRETYGFLMQTLHRMLTIRFNQRNECNEFIDNWDYYQETIFDLVNSKKASLFVVYDAEKPVQISINYHYKKILFVSIPSFDVNYSRFSLGNISIYKLLEWALKNDYDLLDLEYGFLEYKRRWSNHVYSYDHHVIYPKNDSVVAMFAGLEIGKIKIKNYFKSLNFDDYLKRIKNYLRRKNKVQKDLQFITEIIDGIDTSPLKALQVNSDDYSKIRKPIYDHLFIHNVHIDSLKIFKNPKSDKEYFLVDETIIEKINIL